MKILLFADPGSAACTHQMELLKTELEQSAHEVVILDDIKKIPVILNQPDILHLLCEKLPLNIVEFSVVASAKALGIKTLVSCYGNSAELGASILSHRILQFQWSYFDSLSVAQSQFLKKLRSFNGHKFILPALPQFEKRTRRATKTQSPTLVTVTPATSDFVLPHFPADPNQEIYFDARWMLQSKKISDVRKKFAEFNRKNKKTFCLTQKENIYELLSENTGLVYIANLDLNSFQIAQMIQLAFATQSYLILSLDQASGFADVWSPGRNCLIENTRFPALPTQKMAVSRPFLVENKINELSRVYTKVKNRTESLKTYENLPYRS